MTVISTRSIDIAQTYKGPSHGLSRALEGMINKAQVDGMEVDYIRVSREVLDHEYHEVNPEWNINVSASFNVKVAE